MTDSIRLVGRLRAFEAGQAVRAASHLQVAIQPHALVICPLAMAGEDTTIHAIAIGPINGPPQIRAVPDPRVRDDHYALIAWMGEIIERYFQERRLAGEFPQIWVSSGAAAGHLDILADRLRFTRDAPAIQRTGALLTYVTERMPIAGQQALMTATGALSAHYCTGQQEGEDEHLGVFLAWLSPPDGIDIRLSIERAERQVMGAKTDPEFDRAILQPLLKKYNLARRDGATAAELQRRARAIEAQLAPIVHSIFTAVQCALGHLRGQFPPAAVLSELDRCEAQAFESFMQARDDGHPLPYRDTPKAGAFKISERELAVQNTERGALYGDQFAQAKARLDGRIMTGICGNVITAKAGRKSLHRFDLETPQSNLHLRSGDEFALLRDPRLRCVVENVQRVGTVTRVSFLLTAGMKCVGAPPAGSEIDLVPPPPDWFQLIRMRTKMAARLATPPWTHAGTAPPDQPPPTVARPSDLLAAVELLR